MMRLATWAWSACLTSCVIGSSGLEWLPRAKEHLGKCHPCLAFKARQVGHLALEVRDTVLVHVTAFKGRHKIQDRWEVKGICCGKVALSNVPVYVVRPKDGEGHSRTFHRNYLLPISSNLEQAKKDEPVVGIRNDTSPPPVPSVGNAPTKSGPSGIVTSNLAHNTPRGSPDRPASLRCSIQTTRNWLPWRYRNFGLFANTGPTSIWDAWVDLCICLCVVICLYAIFRGCTV